MNGHFNERELIEGIRRGDVQAFGRLYDRYAPALYGVILKMVGDAETAETILQKSFLKINALLTDSKEFSQPLFHSLLQIARSTAQSVKVKGNEKSEEGEIYGSKSIVYGQSNTSMFKNEGTAVQLSASSGQNPDKAIDLVYFKGYGLLEAAEKLGITIAELKIRIRMELKNSRGVQ